MKKVFRMASLLSGSIMAISLSGCIVPPPARIAPPAVAYVAPTYPQPGPGYVWAYHPRFGWGWHHPEYGWHRGWD